MNLSPNFTLEEMTFSQIALRQGLDNTPSPLGTANLRVLANELLEPARALLGVPLHVDSGYRSAGVNAAVGGALGSAHMDGRAADCVPIGAPLEDCFDILKASNLPIDQILFECRAWIHLAIAPVGSTPRRIAMTATGGPGNWNYQRVA